MEGCGTHGSEGKGVGTSGSVLMYSKRIGGGSGGFGGAGIIAVIDSAMGEGDGAASAKTFLRRLRIQHAKMSAARTTMANPTNMQIMPVNSSTTQVVVLVAVLLVDVVKV